MAEKKPKIYEPESIPEQDLPENVIWETLIGKPENLEDLDRAAATALAAASTAISGLGDLAYEDVVTELQIANQAVTNAKIAVNAIQGDVIAANAITTTKINDNAISSPKIQAGAIVAGKIAAGAIVANDIAALTITGDKIAAATITSAKITTGEFITLSAQIKDAIITNAKINDLSADKINAGTIAAARFSTAIAYITNTAQIANAVITNAKINDLDAGKLNTGTLSADRIAAGSIVASKLSVSQLSAVAADLGTITAGTFRVSSRINIQTSGGTAIGYLGQDPNSSGIWGFIAERGYGLMCRYSGANYFRIYMDSGSDDAVIDMPSPNKIKVQDNEGNAIARFYGRNAGFSGLGGLDLFGPVRLFTGTAPSGAQEGMLYYNTTYDEVWVYRASGWKALAYVP